MNSAVLAPTMQQSDILYPERIPYPERTTARHREKSAVLWGRCEGWARRSRGTSQKNNESCTQVITIGLLPSLLAVILPLTRIQQTLQEEARKAIRLGSWSHTPGFRLQSLSQTPGGQHPQSRALFVPLWCLLCPNILICAWQGGCADKCLSNVSAGIPSCYINKWTILFHIYNLLYFLLL